MKQLVNDRCLGWFAVFTRSILAVVIGLSSFAEAGELRNVGVLGNSGESGKTLVRFSPRPVSGMGVVYDEFGTLWDRGGDGRLNRYAVDGRLFASFTIPTTPGDGRDDVITQSGNTFLLKIGSDLYALPMDAVEGALPAPLKVKASRLSVGTHDGWAAALDGLDLFLVNAAGDTQPLATLPEETSRVGITPEGVVYVQHPKSRQVRRIKPGSDVLEDIPGDLPGDRPQRIGDHWYGHRWGSTIWRLNAALDPEPGVVIGGASGSFIGHLELNSELTLGRGLAQLQPNLYAVSGFRGVVQLLEWKPEEKRMVIVRRIGAIQECRALGLDRDGRVWHAGGCWEWRDAADAPMRPGIPQPDSIFGITMLDSDRMVAYGRLTEKPALFYGVLKSEVARRTIDTATALPKEAVGVAAVLYQKQPALFVLENDGKCTAIFISSNGEYKGEAGTISLYPVSPLKEWQSLVSLSQNRVLAAADGHIIEFHEKDGEWHEVRRWNAWGRQPDETFGSKIKLSTDAGRVWVSDTERHRVVCLDLATQKLLGVFGKIDAPGDDLVSLNAPTAIAARGKRGVIFDSANQRLIKLELREE